MKINALGSQLHWIPLGFVNAYAITLPDGDWVLVDSGLKTNLLALSTLDIHFGKPPLAIILTHGHLDHVGSAGDLAEQWGVKVYAHRMEKPFLTGKSAYPPQDPTVGGALAQAARLMPHTQFDLTGQLEFYGEDGTLPFLPDWKVIETPGHSPGHVSFWHESDRVLIAGDSLATADFDSVVGMVTHQPQQLGRGGTPFNCDWGATTASVKKLAELEPLVIAAGHGIPMVGSDVPQKLHDFADHFAPPAQGRYVVTPAITDESGIVFLPPPRPDVVGVGVAAVAGVATVVGLSAGINARRKKFTSR